MDARAQAVLDFWFGAPGSPAHGRNRPEWFRKDAAFDAEICARFGALIDAAIGGGLRAWDAAGAASALARILLLDQFTRNAFRGTARSFAGDALALQAAQAMVATGQDLQLPPLQRWFVYLPYEHAERPGRTGGVAASVRRARPSRRGPGRHDGVCAAAPRHRASLRPLPASQRDPRAGVHRRGTRVPAGAGVEFLDGPRPGLRFPCRSSSRIRPPGCPAPFMSPGAGLRPSPLPLLHCAGHPASLIWQRRDGSTLAWRPRLQPRTGGG